MSESSSTNFKSLSSRIEISGPEINQGAVLKRSCPENLNIAQIEMEKIEKNDKQWYIHNSAATKNDTYFESVKFLYRDNFTLTPPPPPPPSLLIINVPFQLFRERLSEKMCRDNPER